jgi:hypothetical protein
LDLLAARCPDPTAEVYKRLFARHPYMRQYFWRDSNSAIKGEMLSRTFEAILDFIGPRRYSHIMISTEMVTHEGYDVPREVFITFFATIRDATRDLLAGEWSTEFEAAWSRLLADIQSFADQTPRSDVDSVHTRAVRAQLQAQGMKPPN